MLNDNDNFYPEKPKLSTPPKGSNMSKYILIIGFLLLLFSNLTSSNYWIIIFVIGAVVLHEFGHFIGMRLFRYNEPNFIFYSIIAQKAKNRFKPVSQKNKILTLQMGPIPGLIVGTVLFYAALESKSEVLFVISMILLTLNLFSLLPIDPLDGGNIIKNLFFPKSQKPYLVFVLISSIIVIAVGYLTGLYMLIILGFLMGFKVRSIQKNMLIYDELEEQKINYNQSYNNLTDRDYWKIRNVFLDFNPKLESIIPSRSEIWENEKLLSNQVKQLLKVDIKLDASPFLIVLSFAIYLFCLLIPVYLYLTYSETIMGIFQNLSMNV